MAEIVKIVNYARLKRKFRRMPDMVKAQIRKSMEESANEIVGMMKRLVPVGSSGRAGSKKSAGHGALRDSIGWTWGKAPKGAFAVAAAKDPNGLTLTIYAGDKDAFYARWVEFGTAPHVIRAKSLKGMGKDGRLGLKVDHPGAAASPFFFPAWRANRKPARAKLRKAVREAARQVAAIQ
ncbi:MAG: HK97 gp10 family phage protein [Pseudomonadota bacterium]